MNIQEAQTIEEMNPVAGIQVLLLGALAIIAGTLLAAVILPTWLPGLADSILGDSPKVFWYLSRGSALVSYFLLWASMAFGLIITNRLARVWPGGAPAVDLHQYFSLLGLGFGLFHALILMGDRFIQMNIFQVLIPFNSQNYQPVWVGLGQVAFYIWILLVGSFYVRKQLGGKTWRLIHYSSFLMFALVTIHGLVSGTDSHTVWANAIYWISGGSLLFLLYYRIMVTVGARSAQRTGIRR
jgi:predicted ferric reductase